jgi:phosphatidylglycerophosphate synthase
MNDPASHNRYANTSDAIVLCIIDQTHLVLWSHNLADRIRRQFARENILTEISADELRGHRGAVVLVRADAVLDQPLVGCLLGNCGLLLTGNETTDVLAAHVNHADIPVAVAAMRGGPMHASPGLSVKSPEMLETHFWKTLRKRETPYALRVTDTSLHRVEWRMFMGTYKGATDVVTKHVWPRPAFYVTRWLASRGVTPNMVTSVAAVATVLAFYLFFQGQFALGLTAAWLMTFLDTVDGKLARTTLTSSKWGDIFDHGIDLVHPPFWYVAWAIGVGRTGQPFSDSVFWWVTGIILGGYVLQRVMEGVAIKWLGLEIHIWRRIDTLFRQITARRNPNLILLTLSTLIGRPDLGLIAVATWTATCLVLHGLQLLQAFDARAKVGPKGLQSWMTQQ